MLSLSVVWGGRRNTQNPGKNRLILRIAPTARLTDELIARDIKEIQVRQSFKRLRNGAWTKYNQPIF